MNKGYGMDIVVGCVGISVIGFLFLFLVAMFGPSTHCDICDTEFKNKKYMHMINGQKHWLCPSCNRRMDSGRSSAAFDNFLQTGKTKKSKRR